MVAVYDSKMKGHTMNKTLLIAALGLLMAGCTIAEWQDPNGKPQAAANRTQDIVSGVKDGLDATPPFPMKEAMYGVLAVVGGIATAVQSVKKKKVVQEKSDAETAVFQIVKGVENMMTAGKVTKGMLKEAMDQSPTTKHLVSQIKDRL